MPPASIASSAVSVAEPPLTPISSSLYGSDGELGAGLVLADDAAVKTLALLENRLHPLLDVGDVLGRERALDVEVVVEAVGDRRADPELGVGEEILHRLGHDVSGRVADDRPALVGVGRDRLDDVAVLGVVGEVLDRAVASVPGRPRPP